MTTKVAILGCGGVARHAHVPAWLAQNDVKIVALCDKDGAAAGALKDRFHLDARVYTSLEAMLAESDANVVDICTPGFMHKDQARICLMAGRHVLVEKPPVMGTADALELIELAKTRNLKLGAVLNYRYQDLMLEAKRHVDSGVLGTITKISVVHHAGNVYGEAPWMWNESRSKYLLYEFGVHFIDSLVYLCGPHAEILHVLPMRARTCDDTTDLHVAIRFASGAVGFLELTSDFTKHSSHLTTYSVYGTGMDMFIRKFPAMVRLASGVVNPLDVLAAEVKAIKELAIKIGTGQFLKWRNVSHQRVITLFDAWVKGGAEYPLALANILPTIRLLEAIEAHIPAYQAGPKA